MFCLRHIQTYSAFSQEHLSDTNWIQSHNHLVHKRTLNHLAKLAILVHTDEYSQPCISVPYSEPCQFLITIHIQTLRYITNIILNIFTKVPSWTIDTFWMPLSFIDAIYVIFQTYSGIFKTYSAIFSIVKGY